MDCVTASGDTAILYSAHFGWRGVALHYNSLLCCVAGQTESRSSMRQAQVREEGAQIEYSAPGLKVKGAWQQCGNMFRAMVYEGSEGVVAWNCLQTGSDVTLRIGEMDMHGLGYAECLTVTVPPWRLPMKTLRWGRFVSREHSLIWIDWQGEYSTSLAVFDGRRSALRKASEEEIAAEGATLRMSESLPLRSGRLGDTVLPSMQRLKKLLPGSLGAIEEHKWRSRGVLDCGEQTTEGWVIHEVVHWN